MYTIYIMRHWWRETNLVEAAMEDLFDFRSLKSNGLKVSFVVVVEERQGLSRVWVGEETRRGNWHVHLRLKLLSTCTVRLIGHCLSRSPYHYTPIIFWRVRTISNLARLNLPGTCISFPSILTFMAWMTLAKQSCLGLGIRCFLVILHDK